MVDRTIEAINNGPLTPYLRLEPVDRAVDVYSTKLGGVPYLPTGFEYPVGSRSKLALLAQFNLDELPKLPDWPQTGMLQFYIGIEPDYGLEDGALVVHHPTIEPDASKLSAPPADLYDDPDFDWEYDLPFKPGFQQALDATPAYTWYSPGDYRFDDEFDRVFKAVNPGAKPRWSQKIQGHIWETFEVGGSRLGGYPAFDQEDPRAYGANAEMRVYDTMLFCCQSIFPETYGDYDHMLNWGDAGIGNFFIPAEKLRAGDFSDTLFLWDCG
jgi:uncharacterized protein YwqG